VPGAARALADRLRTLADALERSPEEALRRLSAVADDRRRMRLPPLATPLPSRPFPR